MALRVSSYAFWVFNVLITFQQEMNDMFQDQLRQFICKELCAKARK